MTTVDVGNTRAACQRSKPFASAFIAATLRQLWVCCQATKWIEAVCVLGPPAHVHDLRHTRVTLKRHSGPL